jgi:hypothetical protein
MSKLYSAAVTSNNNINVFDVEKGVKRYSINTGGGKIINGPIITQDKLTVVVQDVNGITRAKIYSLGKGVLSYSFTIK